MLTYYELLGVPRDASQQDIKTAYRKLVKEHHPDRAPNGNPADIAPEFHDLAEAYQVLKDPKKRAVYDSQIARSLVPHEQLVIERSYSRTFAFGAGIMGGLVLAALVLAYGPLLMPKTGPGAGDAESASAVTALEVSEGSAAPDGMASVQRGVTTARKEPKQEMAAAGDPPAAAEAPPAPSPADMERAARQAAREARWAELQTSHDLAELATFSEAEAGTEEGRAAASRLAGLIASSTRIDELSAASERAGKGEARNLIAIRVAELQAEIEREASRSTAWGAASRAGTVNALQAFLKTYPDGAWSDEARDRLRRLGLIEIEVHDGRAQATVWVRPGDPSAGFFRDCPECPEMTAIPPGEFRHRHSRLTRNQPPSPGEVVRFQAPFAVSRIEVTAAEWDACVRDRRCRRVPTGSMTSAAPITDVSWHDAMDYVSWLSRRTGRQYRLLSEAEWEYAARAGSPYRFVWGENPDAAEAAYREADFLRMEQGAVPVAAVPPPASRANAWGLENLHGNVVEWVADCWLRGVDVLPVDGRPVGPEDGADCGQRMLKGGSWVASSGRRLNRSPEIAETRDIFTGFRVARDF